MTQVAEKMMVLDPLLARRKAVDVPLAPRKRTTWEGAVVALLDNTKHRADTILDAVQELVMRRGAARVIRVRKASASLPMAPALAQRLLAADLFVTAVGD